MLSKDCSKFNYTLNVPKAIVIVTVIFVDLKPFELMNVYKNVYVTSIHFSSQSVISLSNQKQEMPTYYII